MTDRNDSLPAFHVPPVIPHLPAELYVPDWREIDHYIPADWQDDGSSDPVLLRLISFLPFAWARRLTAAVNTAGRRHDYLFGPARLPGSPYYGITMQGANECYRRNILDKGYRRVSRIHWRAVEAVGALAWERSARQMMSWGWYTYADFLRDPDHSYTADADGIRDGAGK